MNAKGWLLCVGLLVAVGLWAGESDTADLTLRIPANPALRYDWRIESNSESGGLDGGKPFTIQSANIFAATLSLKSLPVKVEGGALVGLRLQELTVQDKRSIGENSVEVNASKGQIKALQDGKVVIDTENDIGADQAAPYRQQIKTLENSEMRLTLDPSGRQKDVQGDAQVVENLKGSAQGIFPILAGKTLKVGESWEDSYTLDKLSDFRLAKPTSVNSKMTFVKWEERNGRKLALIELVSAWAKQDLKGERSDGMLVQLSHIDGRCVGTCLFDPATGYFVEGSLTQTMGYHMDGERECHTSGLDVKGKTVFSFKLKQLE